MLGFFDSTRSDIAVNGMLTKKTCYSVLPLPVNVFAVQTQIVKMKSDQINVINAKNHIC